ncbi:MAG: hypothetical protein ACKVUS_17130 [Saprospiraceae bacterium]
MATNKPEIEQFIQAFNASATRTRALLIGLLFASILASIALIDSVHSWYGARIEIRQVALQWFVFPEDNKSSKEDGTVICLSCDSLKNGVIADTQKVTPKAEIQAPAFHSVQEFAISLENQELNESERWDSAQIENILRNAINLEYFPLLGKNKSDLPYWISIKPFESGEWRVPDKKQRKLLYQALSRAAAVSNDYSPHSRQEFEYALENLMEAKTENFTLVRMPILGVSFDINYLGIISGLIFSALMALLYLSMVRENRNLKTLFQHGLQDKDTDGRRLYELLSMYQVLTVPQKLYRPDNKSDLRTRNIIEVVFWFPYAVLLLIFVYDCISFKIGLSLNPNMTIITSLSTLLSLASITYFSFKLNSRQRSINRLWDNQYFRLHIENFVSPNPTNDDAPLFATLPQAKINWTNTAYRISREQPLSENKSVERLREFLNLCYDDSEDKRDPKLPNLNDNAYWAQKDDECWKVLQEWFEKNKQHSTRKQFRVGLTEMMNSLQPPDKSSNTPINK